MRIHIGRISPALAERINELEQRLDRYGKRTSPLSLHKKEFGTFYFAFVDMDIDKKQYGMLCTALNGVLFRQSRLEVKQAGPSYIERMQFGKLPSDNTHVKLNEEQRKRLKSSSPRILDTYSGRMRTSSQIRQNPTFRVMIKEELRKPKMRKRKLWGIEKRPLSKLTNHFVDGEWRDSEGKAIEIVSALHDEHAQARKIAEDLANNAVYLSDSEFEDFKETARDIGKADSDDEIEIVPKGEVPAASKVSIESDEESDNGPGEALQPNTTESLRSALAADTPFTLFGGPSEVDSAANTTEPKQVEPDLARGHAPVLAEPKVGLFFAHQKSPYLRSQSQAAKFTDDFEFNAWETEFFANRSEWNRSLKKRRRDAARMARRMGKKRGE